ncbi:short-chain dehydrogenase [Sorangium cellulosum]|uniref:Short-chain dehydrogenase n=1 Tax=Sorangium cellulosum TaxID=56 RepID=A0A4P2QE89_SORCE|nr:SDR family oxidoreductase [Sorangium cellulosum]AUX27483.1 short-chain dehydrogenase [Sorangium cellulosum]
MRERFRDTVVVITGASSGIGRATALEFARRGAAVTLAARREQPLREVAAECEQAGGKALVVPADVTNEALVMEVARRTVEAFGRIDVWVNNAAVTLFGLFEQTPSEPYRRVIETNLFGYIHGARAALAQFRRQGSGVLINVASMVSRLSEPYVSAYVASKHAIRGLSQSLRQELEVLRARDIHVCVVMPATIDTPLFQHAGNYTGRAPRAMPPVYPPERVARAIVRLARTPRREVYVGSSALQLALLSFLAPGLTERLLARTVDRLHLQHGRTAYATNGNLFTPLVEGTTVSGGWKPRGKKRLLRAAVVGLAALAPAMLGLLWLRPRLLAAR